MCTFRTTIRLVCSALLAVLLLCLPSGTRAEPNPLRVSDLSSPRSALQGFLAATDSIYARWADLLDDYLNSGSLYLTAEQRQALGRILHDIPDAVRVLDLSNVPPVLTDTFSLERALQLREILDRIPLPAPGDIPDAAAMTNRPAKRWRLPDTEIDFVQVQQGPRAGDYLISPETIARLPEFYRRIRDLPYKPGPGRRLVETYRRFGAGRISTISDVFASSPLGLSSIIPMRWMLGWPDWSRAAIGGAAVWQWIGLGGGVLIAALLLSLSRRLAARLSRQAEDSPHRRWHTLPLPIGLIVVTGLLIPMLCTLLHIGGTPRVVVAMLETAGFYFGCMWLALVGSGIAGELIVGAEHLATRSLDGQLIRLGSRLVGVVVAIGCLVRGADELGFPAYSVLAGLGVGGLAVALAAKDANLLGSLLLMFEKPFRVGHIIRLSGTEGTVEDVGFRSTRIRTPDNSLVSIPNDSVINTKVENLTLRPRRRQRFTIGVTYDTPRETLEAFVAGIRQAILDHNRTSKDNVQVTLNNLSDSSLDILVNFHLAVTDIASEVQGRHEILLQIMELAERMGVSFAYPTRTLLIDGATAGAAAGRGESGAVIPLRS